MKRTLMFALWAAFAALVLITSAWAQNYFSTTGGAVVDGKVMMCLDANGKAEPATAAGTCLGSGGGGGGAVTVADGADVTQGAKADAAYTGSGSPSVVALLKGLYTAMTNAIPSGTNVIGYTTNDPCTQGTKLGAVINVTSSGGIITGTTALKTYICSIDIVTATAQNIALVEGTGTICATNIYGLAGGTSAATGWNFAANGGLTKGNGGATVYSPSADTNATAANVCLLLSSTGQTSGQITYVQK